jgi:hypothetical protein
VKLIVMMAASSLMLATFASTAAAQRQSWRFDFEAGIPEELTIDGAQVATNPALVIAGAGSLFASSLNQEGEWHEFLHTGLAVKLQPGTAYRIRFEYRIIDPGSGDLPKTRFYSLLRSRNGRGEDLQGQNWQTWMWTRERGARDVIDRLFEIAADGPDDYFLIIGIRKQGALVIDDLTIDPTEPGPPGAGLPVKPGKPILPAAKAELDAARKRDGLDQPMGDMLVVLCDEGAGQKARDRKDQIVADLAPDYVDWSPIGPLAAEYGIRSSRGGIEYQELYGMEADAEIWQRRFELFVDSGFVRSLDNTLVQDETWGPGGYYMCHNGDNWHAYFNKMLLQKTTDWEGVCQDNIACAPWNKGGGCFCKACDRWFRAYLGERYTAGDLLARGVADLDTFSMRERIVRYGLVGNEALRDPLIRDYIKFQYISQLARWVDTVRVVKQDARRRGRVVAVYGNDIGCDGDFPFAVALSQYTDVVEIEELRSIGDRVSPAPAPYKVGLASGDHEKPVWVRGPVHDKNNGGPLLSPAFWSLHLGQALANGGVRDLSLGYNAPNTGDPRVPDYVDDPGVYGVYQTYSQFMRENRSTFTHRDSEARVAVVYSLPSMIFRRFQPLAIADDDAFGRFSRTLGQLQAWHVPFDVIVFGHPEMGDDSASLARLTRYTALVLPTADALTDTQAQALRDSVARGGTVITAGPLGTRDQDYNPHEQSAVAGMPTLDWGSDQARAALREAAGVEVDAPESVTVNVWRSADGQSLDVHLVNYDIDVAQGTLSEVGPVTVRVRLPQGLAPKAAQCLRPGEAAVEAAVTVAEGWAEVAVPRFAAYTVACLGDPAAREQANQAATSRRERDKAAVSAAGR